VLLGRKWALHDVDDVEGFCASAIHRRGLELSHHDRQDLLAFLVSETWRLSGVYEPGGRVRFSTFATHHLGRRQG
jgi:hypothetical protein